MQEAPEQRPVPPVVHALGWYGTAAILFAYFALSREWLEQGPLYHTLNLTGALGVATICWWRRTWPAFWLEAAWALIAVAALAA